jgi:hypothetical protein
VQSNQFGSFRAERRAIEIDVTGADGQQTTHQSCDERPETERAQNSAARFRLRNASAEVCNHGKYHESNRQMDQRRMKRRNVHAG